jgi:hypothetical protein
VGARASGIAIFEEAHNEADHAVFMAGIAFGNKESKRDERAVIKAWPSFGANEV